MKLSNGAKLHFAYHGDGGGGYKPNGLCLAETETDWVTWRIYWDGVISNPNIAGCEEVWEAEVGHYFPKLPAGLEHDPGAARQLAELDFGKRLAHLLTANSYEGLKETCEP
jgi:hypothetical protein